ncbi:MAG: type IX secretion system outer membrane channel protein PorV [Thermonemataceae bacterium]|nr:type IX secretion system outer membrane channel protein PorV [Thermonemataceae bacterium]
MKKAIKFYLAFIIGNIFIQTSNAQSTSGQLYDTTRRPITTAVPFLLISPDSRAAGMGDAGVATSPDANGTFWNPAKIAFSDKKIDVALSYTPWLRQLVNDMSISYLSGYYKWDEQQAVTLALTYFDLGDINFTDGQGTPIGDYRPREFAVRSHYARRLTNNLSLSVGAFFVHSNIANVYFSGNGTSGQSKPGTSGGVDLSAFYQKKGINIANLETDLAFGAAITNLGAKISYSGEDDQRDFLPTNFRLGAAGTSSIDEFNKVSLAVDFNKLMVPTPPLVNSQGTIIQGQYGRDIPLLSGIFSSFTDAPDGFKEELQEWRANIGAEYSYNDLFMVRAGLALEHKNKGNRKYATVGIGARYQVFGLDAAYMIPFEKGNPLAETFRITISAAFGDKKQEASKPAEEENTEE